MGSERTTVFFPKDGVMIDCDQDEFELVRRRIERSPNPEPMIGVPRGGSGTERPETMIWFISGGGMRQNGTLESAE